MSNFNQDHFFTKTEKGYFLACGIIIALSVAYVTHLYFEYRVVFIYNSWNVVMDHEKNPLSNIPDFSTRHMIMQVLAWMWCIVFAIIVGSMWAGVFSMILHVLILGAIAITVATFETAKRKPQYFGGYGRGNGGEHE